MIKVFLSYSRKDNQFVEKLYNKLKKDGVDCFKDTESIRAGDHWPRKLAEALENCKVIIPVLSPNSYESDYVKREVEIAFADDPVNKKRECIPVLFEESNIHPLLKGIQHIDMSSDDKFEKNYANLLNKLVPYHQGIVPVHLIHETEKRLPFEVFAAELLTRPILLRKDKFNNILVMIKREGINEAVISTRGKSLISGLYVSGKEEYLINKDKEIQQFLVGNSNENSFKINLKELGLPLRWASGGILSIVNFKKKDGKLKKWIPLFFRDIEPFGWNIALGSSERYFNGGGKITSKINDELNNPWRFILREFLEETLILNNNPETGSAVFKTFNFGEVSIEKQRIQASIFAREHIDCRYEFDDLEIYEDRDDFLNTIRVRMMPTNTDIQISHYTDKYQSLSVLICFNLLELGIEVVKIIQYNLCENDYMLDGEIYKHNDGTNELIRMPFALISYDYLQKNFGANYKDPEYTKGAQPSIIAKEDIPEEDIKIFDWDIKQRIKIARGEKESIGTEKERYNKWYEEFGDNFVDKKNDDRPIETNASKLFTPASVKILNNYFCSISNSEY